MERAHRSRSDGLEGRRSRCASNPDRASRCARRRRPPPPYVENLSHRRRACPRRRHRLRHPCAWLVCAVLSGRNQTDFLKGEAGESVGRQPRPADARPAHRARLREPRHPCCGQCCASGLVRSSSAPATTAGLPRGRVRARHDVLRRTGARSPRSPPDSTARCSPARRPTARFTRSIATRRHHLLRSRGQNASGRSPSCTRKRLCCHRREERRLSDCARRQGRAVLQDEGDARHRPDVRLDRPAADRHRIARTRVPRRHERPRLPAARHTVRRGARSPVRCERRALRRRADRTRSRRQPVHPRYR